MSFRDPLVLRRHISSIISLYHARCIDRAYGGYINQLRNDRAFAAMSHGWIDLLSR